MAERGDSEGFGLTPPQHNGARRKDSYKLSSWCNTPSMLKETEVEYKRVKSDLRSDSSRSPSPAYHQSSRWSKNFRSLKIAKFYPTDVELWFNQIETQFDLHDITDDDERYRLICAALSGEVASDVRDVLLQPFRTQKYFNLKEVLIERRGLTTSERVNKVISGEKLGNDIPSSFLRHLQKTSGFEASCSCRQSCHIPGFHTTDADIY